MPPVGNEEQDPLSALLNGELDYTSEGADDTDETFKDLAAKRGDDFKPTDEPAPAADPAADPAPAAGGGVAAAAAAAAETPAGDPKPGETPAGDPPAGDPPAAPKPGEAPAGDPPAGDPKAAADPAPGETNPMVPKRRYDSVKSRLDTVQAELERYKKGEVQPDAPSFNANDPSTWTPQQKLNAIDQAIGKLDAATAKAVADGQTEEYSRLRTQERNLINARAQIVAEQTAAQSTAGIVERQRYDRALATLETNFPTISPDSPHYNEALAGNLAELTAAFEASGLTESQALIKAATLIESQLEASVAPLKQPTPPPVQGKAELTEAEKAAAAAKAGDRKAEAVGKAVAAANKQPPSTTKVGVDSAAKGQGAGKVSVMEMSDEEYDALPESKKRELRGDARVPV